MPHPFFFGGSTSSGGGTSHDVMISPSSDSTRIPLACQSAKWSVVSMAEDGYGTVWSLTLRRQSVWSPLYSYDFTHWRRCAALRTEISRGRMPSLLSAPTAHTAQQSRCYSLGSDMISNRGLRSSSEYVSATYSCSPDLDNSFDPSQTRTVDRNVSAPVSLDRRGG